MTLGLRLSMEEKAVAIEVPGGDKAVMMQCGMFVAAEEFEAAVASELFTHFKHEEDATMKSGKLNEELVRMDAIARQIRPADVVLFNESFAATNEREGRRSPARSCAHFSMLG